MALTLLPLHEGVHIQGQNLTEHPVLGVAVAEDGAALGHRRQSRLEVRQSPAHGVPHRPGRAQAGLDVEGGEDLVELAVLLGGLQDVLHEARPAPDLRIVLDEGPQVLHQIAAVGGEVLQNALGPVLPQGQAGIGGHHVGDIPGDELGIELGEARAVVGLGVVLGVIPDLDAVLVAGLVELQDVVALLVA